jgi:hypothetical protein
MRSSRILILALALPLAGCTNDGPLLFEKPPPAGPIVSFSADVQPVFTLNCASLFCHGSFHSQDLWLEPGHAFEPTFGLVGVPSEQAPAVLRVHPGDSAASYLIHKLQGTQRQVGGSGTPMPQGSPLLDPQTIDTIKRWIDDGAQDN